ncbi:MAG TPA: hypothetical protein VJ385_07410 [Fibrobacteria bacterium]|nr:hypothetical protein [Fibrobacteria bacterium]
MPDKGKGSVSVQVSVDNGETWIHLADHYTGLGGLPILPWTPDKGLGASSRCLIQVTNDADSTMRARMEGFFNLIQ